jgi:hypothetical protein
MPALNTCGLVTVAFTVMAPLAGEVSVWLLVVPTPIVYAAALEVSKTMLLTVTPNARSMFVLLLPGLLNVAESPTPGAGDTLQLVLFDHVASAVPFHVALAAREVIGTASTATSPKLKANLLVNGDSLKDDSVVFISFPVAPLFI